MNAARKTLLALMGERGPFMPGDKVLVKRPLDNSSSPSWVNKMLEYDGRVLVVERKADADFGNEAWFLVGAHNPAHRSNRWFFQTHWLTLVEDE